MQVVANRGYQADRRVLLAGGLIGAPMMLVLLISKYFGVEIEMMSQADGWVSLIYMLGWLCTAAAMRQGEVFGRGKTLMSNLQISGLVLGTIWAALVVCGVQGGFLWRITDVFWPASHVFSLVLGVVVIRAGVWTGWKRVPLFLIGCALPSFFFLQPFIGMTAGYAFGVLTFAGQSLLAFAAARTNEL